MAVNMDNVKILADALRNNAHDADDNNINKLVFRIENLIKSVEKGNIDKRSSINPYVREINKALKNVIDNIPTYESVNHLKTNAVVDKIEGFTKSLDNVTAIMGDLFNSGLKSHPKTKEVFKQHSNRVYGHSTDKHGNYDEDLDIRRQLNHILEDRLNKQYIINQRIRDNQKLIEKAHKLDSKLVDMREEEIKLRTELQPYFNKLKSFEKILTNKERKNIRMDDPTGVGSDAIDFRSSVMTNFSELYTAKSKLDTNNKRDPDKRGRNEIDRISNKHSLRNLEVLQPKMLKTDKIRDDYLNGGAFKRGKTIFKLTLDGMIEEAKNNKKSKLIVVNFFDTIITQMQKMITNVLTTALNMPFKITGFVFKKIFNGIRDMFSSKDAVQKRRLIERNKTDIKRESYLDDHKLGIDDYLRQLTEYTQIVTRLHDMNYGRDRVLDDYVADPANKVLNDVLSDIGVVKKEREDVTDELNKHKKTAKQTQEAEQLKNTELKAQKDQVKLLDIIAKNTAGSFNAGDGDDMGNGLWATIMGGGFAAGVAEWFAGTVLGGIAIKTSKFIWNITKILFKPIKGIFSLLWKGGSKLFTFLKDIKYVKNMSKVGKTIGKFFSYFKNIKYMEKIGKAGKSIGKFFSYFKNMKIFTKIGEIGSGISKSFSFLKGTKFITKLMEIGAGFSKIFRGLGKATLIVELTVDAIEALISSYDKLKRGYGWFKTLLEFPEEMVKAAAKGIDGLINIVGWLTGSDFLSSFDAVKNTIDEVFNKIKSLGTLIGDVLYNVFQGIIDSDRESLGNLPGKNQPETPQPKPTEQQKPVVDKTVTYNKTEYKANQNNTASVLDKVADVNKTGLNDFARYMQSNGRITSAGFDKHRYGSKHYTNEALDITPQTVKSKQMGDGLTKQQLSVYDKLAETLKANGYKVVKEYGEGFRKTLKGKGLSDERINKKWQHIHVEGTPEQIKRLYDMTPRKSDNPDDKIRLRTQRELDEYKMKHNIKNKKMLVAGNNQPVIHNDIIVPEPVVITQDNRLNSADMYFIGSYANLA